MLKKDQAIWTVNNRQEETFLRTRPANFDFSKYTPKELRELIATMRFIMRRAGGVGLSANQVGLDMQLFVAEIPQKNKRSKLYAIFNPKITSASKDLRPMEEGCLSIPHTHGIVTRPWEVVLTGLDKHQKPVKIRATGLLARVFQHEYDHLNGIIFTDKAQSIEISTPQAEEVAA